MSRKDNNNDVSDNFKCSEIPYILEQFTQKMAENS